MDLSFLDSINANNITSATDDQLVDKYGWVKAELAELAEELEAYRAEAIVRFGPGGKANGRGYRLSVSNSARATTDWRAVALALAKRAKIGDRAFDNLVAENTDLTEVWRVNCTARIVEG